MGWLFWLPALVILALDQLSKWWVLDTVPLYTSIPVIADVFHITHTRNPGAAFGILPNQTLFFVLVTVLTVIVIVYYQNLLTPKATAERIGLSLLMGGALGNLIDRLRWGYVVDFLDFRVWPVFNLADSAVVVGVAIVIWCLVTHPDLEET